MLTLSYPLVHHDIAIFVKTRTTERTPIGGGTHVLDTNFLQYEIDVSLHCKWTQGLSAFDVNLLGDTRV
jgi:hypothetical protein